MNNLDSDPGDLNPKLLLKSLMMKKYQRKKLCH